MRDVGYTLGSALADIVDNSITAGARRISILADTGSDEPSLTIVDDGIGMSSDELLDAMRLGSRSPLETREGGDLGRFGLGLKTASFSQCRRLTVVSRQHGTTSAARWDLDLVAESDDWIVELPAASETVELAAPIGDHGTAVHWERLDRLGQPHAPNPSGDLVRKLDEAASHLELVFHRFLSGERGLKRVEMSLNGRPLVPFDPFHSSHPATIADPVETIRLGRDHVTIQAFTLPHHKKVTPAEWDQFAGPAGYVRNQGFYVYRGRRLIIHGSWFGLARQTELTKLARVRIDIPNALDAEWKVDIKKASAQLPPQVRERLRHLIETIGATSKRVYTARGRRLTDAKVALWQRVHDKGAVHYQLNSAHPLISEFLARLPRSAQPDLRRLLETISAAVPIDAIFADVSGKPTEVAGSPISKDALKHMVETTAMHLLKEGISPETVREMLKAAEPFRSHWEETDTLITEVSGKSNRDG